jgi:aminomethyltransferase
VVRRLQGAAPPGVTVADRHEEFAVLAVQGPRSAEVLTGLGLPADLGYMSFTEASLGGVEMLVCRSGYTGEHGYELLPPAGAAPAVWTALLEAVRAAGGLPAGLAARDTLRTEMGYPLHGQDLSLQISPVQARAGWAVGWRKPEFWGREALLAERERGPHRLLLGLKAQDRGIPRPGMAVTDTSGRSLGSVTSGTFSPTLRTGIALALVEAGTEEGGEVLVDVRGRPSRMVVTRPPFVDSRPA